MRRFTSVSLFGLRQISFAAAAVRAPAFLLLPLASLAVLAGSSAHAQTTSFTATTGNYLTGTNWTAGVPSGSINAAINTNRTAQLAGAAPTINSGFNLSVGSSGGTRGTLELNTGADLTVNGIVDIRSNGLAGSGNSGVVNHNGGTLTVGQINVGSGLASGQTPANTDPGRYNLAGGTLTATTLNLTPNSSRGEMVVSGGTATVTTMTIGNNGGAGELTISGGAVNVSGAFSFNAQGGTNLGTSIVSVSAGSLTLSPGSSFSIPFTLASVNAKRLDVSGSGVVNLGGRSTTWANNGSSSEYGYVNVTGGALNFQNANFTPSNGSTFTGGKITGLNTLQNNVMTINGAEFHVGSNTAAASTTATSSLAGLAFNLTGGSMVFGAFGNNSADLFSKGNLSSANLGGGSIVLDFAYTPQVGDVYNLVDWAGTAPTLSAANISPASYDGLLNVTYDTARWVSHGELTVQNVVIVPEPGTLALLAASAGGALILRRWKCRTA